MYKWRKGKRSLKLCLNVIQRPTVWFFYSCCQSTMQLPSERPCISWIFHEMFAWRKPLLPKRANQGKTEVWQKTSKWRTKTSETMFFGQMKQIFYYLDTVTGEVLFIDQTVFEHRNLKPVSKHHDVNVMFMDCSLYQRVFEENVSTPVQK